MSSQLHAAARCLVLLLALVLSLSGAERGWSGASTGMSTGMSTGPSAGAGSGAIGFDAVPGALGVLCRAHRDPHRDPLGAPLPMHDCCGCCTLCAAAALPEPPGLPVVAGVVHRLAVAAVAVAAPELARARTPRLAQGPPRPGSPAPILPTATPPA